MIAASLLLALFAGLLAVRYVWMSHLAQNWFGVCAVYVSTVAPQEGWDDETQISRLCDCAAVWPMSQMLSHFWVWDFRRFIIHTDQMTKVLDFYTACARVAADETKT